MTPSRSVLLTGATGFLGKVVLYDLFRRREELNLDRVYVLIRPRGPILPEERFEREIAASPCFATLPTGWTRRVSVVTGALEEDDIGLNGAGDDLRHRVTHIIHTAASVAFDLPVAEAARSNITTSLNVLEFARSCRRLERLINVSTAYVTPHPGNGVPIEESLAPLPAPATDLYRAIQDGSANEADLLARSGHPNTYTLTKSIAEHLVMERRGSVPVTIVRPSIISAARELPFPGWIDSTAGFGAFVMLLGLGHLRAIVGDPDTRIDVIPVDDVAIRIVNACHATRTDAPLIQHAVAGLEQAPYVVECWEAIAEYFRTHRVQRRPELRYIGPRGAMFSLADFLHHRAPIIFAGWRTPGMRPRGTQLQARLSYLNRVFPYFTSRSFSFRTSVPIEGAFDRSAYLRTVCRGVYRHMLRRDDSQWMLAGRRHAGHNGDLRWAMTQPKGNLWIRSASVLVTKVLRKAVEQVSVDLPSFEAARRAAPEGAAVVLVPNHRSYLDFILCSYLAFARPDLGIPIPHIAATMEFGRIPILGRLLQAMHAFYLRRGQGKEDPELTDRVHALLEKGHALEFFIEGQRSRSRAFLAPRRGLLRAIQASGRTCVLLPIALTYDRVPEESAFAAELAGQPKAKMRLGPLFRWAMAVQRGEIDLGRVHIACGTPVVLHAESDVHAVSHEVIGRLRSATVTTTYHIDTFLSRHAADGIDAAGLRQMIEQRGGRVLDSELRAPADLDHRIAYTLHHQFVHHFDDAELATISRALGQGAREPETVA